MRHFRNRVEVGQEHREVVEQAFQLPKVHGLAEDPAGLESVHAGDGNVSLPIR